MKFYDKNSEKKNERKISYSVDALVTIFSLSLSPLLGCSVVRFAVTCCLSDCVVPQKRKVNGTKNVVLSVVLLCLFVCLHVIYGT